MLLYGRVAREFGKTPLQLAIEYGFISQKYYDGLRHDERIMIDHHILNELIKAQNEAQEKSMKKNKDAQAHPGMERFDSMDDYWAEVDDANS
jgi:hypothetical protein